MNLNPSIMDRRMNLYLGTFFVMVLVSSLLTIAPVNSVPEKTITKSLDPDEGGLGTVVTITLTIEGTGVDESVIVTDDLKGTGFSYIPLSASITPTSTKKGLITFTLTEDAEITFEVKVTEAYAWDDMVVENEAIAVWSDGTEDSDTAEFTINAFDSLDKYVGDEEHETTAEVDTETSWTLVITVDNPFGFIMEDAVIKDRFGAEIEIDGYDANVWYPDDAGTGQWQYKTKGNSDKVFLTWEIGDLAISGTATLTLEISTDKNPAGYQEYTEAGEDYELNSGATLKFIDPDQDMQLSAYTGSITVDVEEVS
jgi:hypothetical protein